MTTITPETASPGSFIIGADGQTGNVIGWCGDHVRVEFSDGSSVYGPASDATWRLDNDAVPATDDDALVEAADDDEARRTGGTFTERYLGRYLDPLDQAAAELGALAGWETPPDVGDPFVIRVAHRAALTRLSLAADYPAALDRLTAASRLLGIW